jgi:hypothetical protein
MTYARYTKIKILVTPMDFFSSGNFLNARTLLYTGYKRDKSHI